jgi:hypothetical protein
VAKITQTGSLVVAQFFGASLNGPVRAIQELPDGRVLLGGDFTSHVGASRSYLTCFSRDGVPNAMPELATASSSVQDILLQRDGRIMVGTFAGVFRMTADGQRDRFLAPNGTENGVTTLLQQPDNKVVMGGFFENLDGVASPFVARVDAVQTAAVEFKGIVLPALWNDNMGGSLTVSLNPNASFSGRIRVGATSTPITGTFSEGRTWTGTIRSGSSVITVELRRIRSEDGNDYMYGIFTGEFGTSYAYGAAAYYDERYLPALATKGYYTSILNPGSGSGILPDGSSYLTYKIASSGTLTMAGHLADGTAVTYSGRVQAGDWATFYVLLSGNRASLCGSVGFAGRDAELNVHGALQWRRTAAVTATTDNFGDLTWRMNISGSDYDSSIGFGFSPSGPATRGLFAISQGWLGSERLGRQVDIQNNTRLTVPALGPIVEGSPLPINSLVVRASTTTGVITGTCRVPVDGVYRSSTFRSVIVQGLNQAVGSVRIPGATSADGARSSRLTLGPVD